MKSRIFTTVIAIFMAFNLSFGQDIAYDGASTSLFVFAPPDHPNTGIIGIDDYTVDPTIIPSPTFKLTEIRIAARVVDNGDYTMDFFDNSGNFVASVGFSVSFGAPPANIFVAASVPEVLIPSSGRAQLTAVTATGQWIFSGAPPLVGTNDGNFGEVNVGNPQTIRPMDAVIPPNGPDDDGYLVLRLTGLPYSPVPTLGEWGMIFLVLLTLTFGAVMMRVRRVQFAVGGGQSEVANKQLTMGSFLRSLPFDSKYYGQALIVTLGLVVFGFAIAIFAFGYSLTSADIPGVLICVPVLSYLGYLILGEEMD